MQTVTMSIKEFLEYEREKEASINNAGLFGINYKKLDNMCGIIRRDKNLERLVVTALAVTMMSVPVIAADDMNKRIDNLGWMILGLLRTIGYWACILMCIQEVVKSITNGEVRDIGRVSVKYVVAYLVLYLFPMALDIIRDYLKA